MSGIKTNVSYIDTARGIAILMVILVHTAQSIKNESFLLSAFSGFGQMGVQLFFVASAYTLCQSWDRRKFEINKVLNFGIRRFFRIAPVYYLGIFLYFFVSMFENYYRNGVLAAAESYDPLNIIVNLLFLNGLYPPANNTIVPGGWSIGTEMIFYALFPILFALHEKFFSRRGLIFVISVFAFVASFAILSLINNLTGYSLSNNNFLYFNIVTQLPVFLLGMLYWWAKEKLDFSPGLIVSLLGAVFFACSFVYFWYSSILNAFLFVSFCAAVLFCFLIRVFELIPAINLSIFQRIGRVSYSMYLFHFIFAHKLIQLLNHEFRLEDYFNSDLILIVSYAITVFLTYHVANFSEKYIERRFIDFGRILIDRRGALMAARSI